MNLDFRHLRQTMVDSQLQTVGVNDLAVQAAFLAVPRERFVPAALTGLAYSDAPLEVAAGRWLLEPMTLALLIQNSALTRRDRVLIIGAAGGYSAAVAAQLAGIVVALESDPALASAARAAGIETVEGPLAAGWAAAAPYDVILFEGAIEVVPDAISAQLAAGGRVAAVVRDGGVGRAIVGPVKNGQVLGRPFLEVAAHPLPGFARARAFAF